MTEQVFDTNDDGQTDVVLQQDPDTGLLTGAMDTDFDGDVDVVGTDTDGDDELDTFDQGDGPVFVGDGNDGIVTETGDGTGTETGDGTENGTGVEDGVSRLADLTPEQRGQYEGQFWQQQTENGYCAPTSVSIIVSEVLGHRVDAADFVQQAKDLGLMTGEPGSWQGLTISDTKTLLDSFDVPSTVVQPDNASDAWQMLETWGNDGNHGIVAYLDSSEVWDNADDDAQGQALDHAVVVSHVDDQFVYLEDPGTPDGMELQVARDTFMDAWDDSGHGMVVTDAPIGDLSSDASPTDQTGIPEQTGLPDQTGIPVEPSPAQPVEQLPAQPVELTTEPVVAAPDTQQPWAPGQPGLGTIADPSEATLFAPAALEGTQDLLKQELWGHTLVMLPVVIPAGAALLVAARARR